MVRNDAMDCFHAVVPVAYCDFVLLDKHWAAQVTHVRARFEAGGLAVPMATVFTRGRGGVEKLLTALEAW